MFYQTEELTWGKDNSFSFTLRGLSTSDITRLVRNHKSDLDVLFRLAEGQTELDEAFGMEIMERFPLLAAEIVALAADVPDKVQEVTKIPAPIMIRALTIIYDLTITDTGGLENFIRTVTRIVIGVRDQMRQMTHSQSSLSETENNGRKTGT